MQDCTNQIQAIPLMTAYELGTSDLGHFNAILQLVCEISGAPSAAVNLVDAHKQKTLVSINCPVGLECARADSICAIAVDQNMPLIIGDTREDDRVKGNAFVVGEDGIQFYAGFPIYRPAGGTIGALCTFDWHPRALSAQQQIRIADADGMLAERRDTMVPPFTGPLAHLFPRLDAWAGEQRDALRAEIKTLVGL